METPRALKVTGLVIALALLAAFAAGLRDLPRPQGWAAQPPPPFSRFSRLVAEARQRVRPISVSALRQGLASDSALRLIDVREESEWAAGHIAGAIHLGRGVLERDIEGIVPDVRTPIVLYCGGGARSVLAAESLQRMGYSLVYSLEGGYRAWREQSDAAPPDFASND